MSKRTSKPKKKEKEVVDPRQVDFLRFYLDPESETYGNALQSALRAKYSQEYSENILSLMPDWLSESIGKRQGLLVKADRNLDETLDLDITQPAMGMFGPIFHLTSKCCKAEVDRVKDKKKTLFVCDKCSRECQYTKEQVFVRNPKFLAIKHDASKFVAETIGKKYYAKRSELGGLDGKDLPGTVIQYNIPSRQSEDDWSGNPKKKSATVKK